jgi:hypothetical protein
MALRIELLQRGFGAENEHPFTVWTYSTTDPLPEVLAKDYFRRALSQLRLGDLILCGAGQPSSRFDLFGARDRRHCLLMVVRLEMAGIETRLVQDWGSPATPPARPGRRPGGAVGTAPGGGRRLGPVCRPGRKGRRRVRRQLLLGKSSWRG